MNLYLISTKELGDFYVLSEDPTKAAEQLNEALNKADYGFRSQRKIVSIKILANEIYDFPEGKPLFSTGNRLLLPQDASIEIKNTTAS